MYLDFSPYEEPVDVASPAGSTARESRHTRGYSNIPRLVGKVESITFCSVNRLGD